MKKMMKLVIAGITVVYIIPFLITLIMNGVGMEKDKLGLALIAELTGNADSSAAVTVNYSIGSERIDMDSYIAGVLVPAYEYCHEEEFIKIMAVMCRTYIKYCEENQLREELRYYTEAEQNRIWGEEAEQIRTMMIGAVKKTSGQYMVYDGKAIYPYWHKVTSGFTRSASEEKDYLCVADCTSDSLDKEYVTVVDFTAKEMVQKLKNSLDKLFISESRPALQLQIISKTEGGYVTLIQVGNLMIDGDTFSRILGLPSPSFVLSETDEGIRFTVKGQGEGYGLSVCQAAKKVTEGLKYKEVLSFFYKNILFISEE